MRRLVGVAFAAGVLGGPWAGALARSPAGEGVPIESFARPAIVAPGPEATARVALGRALFFDTMLSGGGTMSCASCHVPEHAWQDGRARAVGESGAIGRRRTPSLLDAGHNETFFWDGRARSLEEQVLRPIQDGGEMNRPLDALLRDLAASEVYRARFASAFPDLAPGQRVSAATLADALASFVRTIASGTSAFDRWLAGDEAALTAQAKQGFALFNGPAGCSTCHSGWRFTDEAFHDIGLPLNGSDPDRGRGAIIGVARADHGFRTPALRDVARRAPYMHDGRLADLRAVVDHYAEGVVERPTVSDDLPRIVLSPAERDAIVAFLRSLDSEAPSAGPADPAPPRGVPGPVVVATVDVARVSQRGRKFSTASVHIAHGGRLEITNDDDTVHNIQVFDPRLEFNSGAQERGQVVRLSFAAPGSYTVFCGIHPRMKLKVEAD